MPLKLHIALLQLAPLAYMHVQILLLNYPKKPGFNLYQSWHCAYITYSVKTWFLKKSLCSIYNRLQLSCIFLSLLLQRKLT